MSIDRSADSYPTVGQLERELSQKISALYRTQFGHRVSKVDCHLFDNKLIILFAGIITPIERVLIETLSSHLVDRVREVLDQSIEPKVEQLIETIIGVKVNEYLYNTSIKTGSAVAIVILAEPPQVRTKKSNHKDNQKNVLSFSQPNKKFENLV